MLLKAAFTLPPAAAGGSVESAAETRFVNPGDFAGAHLQILLQAIQTDCMPDYGNKFPIRQRDTNSSIFASVPHSQEPIRLLLAPEPRTHNELFATCLVGIKTFTGFYTEPTGFHHIN
jgi:hypothetical protein